MHRCVNAPSDVVVPTPDGSGQAVHPDVIHVAGGHLGFPYWMACTPYPFGADRHENPIVRVSHDGIVWQPFPGAPDPLVAAPVDASWHHADTDLVLHDDMLHVFYISTKCEGAKTTFSVITSANGAHWSEPRVVYRAPWGVSPALLVGGGQWSMWYIYLDMFAVSQGSVLWRRTGASPFEFGEPIECDLNVPGHVVWHIDVIRADAGFESLVTAFPRGTDMSRSRLFHATSTDGLRWLLSAPMPLLGPSLTGWDNRMIYRSSFVKRDDGSYSIWYSAASWGMRCGIGFVEGPLEQLRAPHGSCGGVRVSALRRLGEDLLGLAKYILSRLLPQRAFHCLLAMNRQVRKFLHEAR